MKIFEILMLVCFGFAWPASIYRSYMARSAKGKSLPFLLIIEAGYISGIINKLINSPDYVMFLYALNLLMVFADIVLYFRNKGIDNLERECWESEGSSGTQQGDAAGERIINTK